LSGGKDGCRLCIATYFGCTLLLPATDRGWHRDSSGASPKTGKQRNDKIQAGGQCDEQIATDISTLPNNSRQSQDTLVQFAIGCLLQYLPAAAEKDESNAVGLV
jgi:hypothetical protein